MKRRCRAELGGTEGRASGPASKGHRGSSDSTLIDSSYLKSALRSSAVKGCGRQSAEPLAKERLDVPGAETIADRLKRLRVVAGEGSLSETDDLLLCSKGLGYLSAAHEFFGIAMVEASHFGAFPLVPDRLVYPEVFPVDHRYRDGDELVDRLARLVDQWMSGMTLRADRRHISARFGRPALAV